jgi:hypothetical protein
MFRQASKDLVEGRKPSPALLPCSSSASFLRDHSESLPPPNPSGHCEPVTMGGCPSIRWPPGTPISNNWVVLLTYAIKFSIVLSSTKLALNSRIYPEQ